MSGHAPHRTLRAVPDRVERENPRSRWWIARRLLELGDRQQFDRTLHFRLVELSDGEDAIADELMLTLRRWRLTRPARVGDHFGLTRAGRVVLGTWRLAAHFRAVWNGGRR